MVDERSERKRGFYATAPWAPVRAAEEALARAAGVELRTLAPVEAAALALARHARRDADEGASDADKA